MARKPYVYESIKRRCMSLIETMNREYDIVYERLESSENPSNESFEKVVTARSSLNDLKDKAPDILQSIADVTDKSVELSIKEELHHLIIEAIAAGQIVAELGLSENLEETITDMMMVGFILELWINNQRSWGNQETATSLTAYLLL